MIARQFLGFIAFIALCVSCTTNAEDKDLSCAERQVLVNSLESGLNLDSEFDTLKVTNLIRKSAENISQGGQICFEEQVIFMRLSSSFYLFMTVSPIMTEMLCAHYLWVIFMKMNWAMMKWQKKCTEM